MSHTIYVGKIAKRKNSTLQPTLSTSFDVLLKAPTSLHTPTFTISAATFDYNYLKWDDRYYFVTDVVSKNNSLWEVSARCDVLATFKADILASTQFVSYSDVSGGAWLADNRIPLLKSASVSKNTTTLNFLFTDAGFYVLSAVGENGCKTYGLDSGNLNNLLQRISTWSDNGIDDIVNDSKNLGYDFSSIESGLESLGKMTIQTGFIGNAYLDAPNCIRSCIWVPFFASFFVSGAGGNTIHLGAFDTGIPALPCKVTPESRTASVNIPWHYSDWRRAVCEEVYLYLPLVGMVSIPSDEIVNETTINIQWSATATDGCIAYRITAGNQVIGTYGANCSVNVPLGISQQASAGEIVQSVIAGTQKTVAGAIGGTMGGGTAGAIVGALAGGIGAAYDVSDTVFSRHNSCIGGIGGGAGVGLSLDATCFTVAHPTAITPSDMAATMGVPTMKPLLLSSCSGYCECANAHVAASGAELEELAEIDAYLNSGFYIE